MSSHAHTHTTTPKLPLANSYLPRAKLAWLLATQALVILPLLFQLPLWLWLVWAMSALWRVQMFRARWNSPNNWIKGTLALSCAAGLYASYAGKTGTEAMVGLLVCAFVLKLLEVKSPREAQLVIFIGFIITAAQFLFYQTPLAAVYGLGCIGLLIATWRSLLLLRSETVTHQLKRSAMVVVHALPIMLILFVVLPRLGPLWAIPTQNAAKTGFSDSLAPGDLGKLALSKEPAFRVEFNGDLPPNTELYWRGLVLDQFDGRRWSLRPLWKSELPRALPERTEQKLLDYSIIVEPHGQQWLFSLLTPVNVQATGNPIRLGNDSLLIARYPLTQRLRYQVRSAIAFTWADAPQLSDTQRRLNTHLPRASNPQTRALVQSWLDQGMDQAQIIAAALALFHADFTYTLQPPLLGEQAVDDFLMSTKRGFCEHFASSFTFMMRAAGIPARVVVGYQGGRWNEYENYLLVNQADAHAWSEVWVDGQGWQTLDPTGAVAPERIEQGLNDALSDEDQSLVSNRWSSSALFWEIQRRLDAADYAWQRWVLSYDTDTQEGLFTQLFGGTEPWRLLAWFVGGALLLFALMIWALRLSHPKPRLRPETLVFQQLERRLAPMGFNRTQGETAQDFLARVTAKEPTYAPSLNYIYKLFEQLAYCNNTRLNADNDLAQAQRLLKLKAAIGKFPKITED